MTVSIEQRITEWAQRIGANEKHLRTALAIAQRHAELPNQYKPAPQFVQARKEAEALLRRMDMPDLRQRVAMSAGLAGITSEQFRAAVHYLTWASNLRPGVQDGTQGRTPFTRFVRALDVNMGIYGLPQMPAALVAALFSELIPDDPRTAHDVEALRARPYVDEFGLEMGEIIPDPPPLK